MTEDGEGRPEPRRAPGSRYSLFVGIAFIILIVIATVHTLGNRDDGILGATATAENGEPLPQFAIPDVFEGPDLDANIFQDDCSKGSNPCPGDDQRTPACQVQGEGVIRVCDLFDKPLVISFWFTGGADCLPTQDIVDRVAGRFDDRVNFLSINVRDDRDKAQGIVEDHGWQIPVGWDRDGAVSHLYRVGGCPTVAFAYPGGLLSEAAIGTDHLSEEQLTADVERLIRESDRRAEDSR